MTATASDFSLNHRAEILAIIDRLHLERTMTIVESSDGQVILSRVLDVRRETNALVFDVSRDAHANDAVFASTSLAFETELDGVKIEFETRAASSITMVDGPAAIVALPTTVMRMQRREWFRAALPSPPTVRCTLVDPHGKTCQAHAIDLSCGGVGLVADRSLEGAELGSGHALIVSLPEVGAVAIEATLRAVHPASEGARGAKVRLGFRFEHLSAKTASQIQRYVQRLEVERQRLARLRES